MEKLEKVAVNVVTEKSKVGKLSEIVPNFGRFFAQILRAGLPQVIPASHYHPCLAARRLEKVSLGYTPTIVTSTEVIGAHTPDFKPNFIFLRLKYSGEYPRPSSGVR